MALNHLMTVSLDIYSVVFYVDSKSVLLALKHWNCKVRKDIIFEIQFLIHCMPVKGINVTFCWIPSHCGLFWNELADFSAKQGASERPSNALNPTLSLSTHEMTTILKNSVQSDFFTAHNKKLFCSRQIEVIIYKLRLNAWNTKYCKNVSCSCSDVITVHHILFDCPVLKILYKMKGIDLTTKYGDIRGVLYDS